MAKTGRKSKYDTEIKPHLKKIENAVKNGATVAEIAAAFNIAESTIYKYKAEIAEFSEIFARGRASIVIEIRAALLKKALGFSYVEEKKVGRTGALGESIVVIERYKRYSPPSETAAAMLLRNYDETWKDKDNATTTLKQQEFELRKAMADENNFDLE